MATKKPATVNPNKALATYDYGELQGQGFDNQGAEDQLLQPIKLLQAQTPEVMDETVKGAKPGMLLEPSSMTVHSKLEFVPVYREHVYTEWVPRDNGGGLVAEHAPDSKLVLAAQAAAGKLYGTFKLDNGNELVETFKLHVVLRVNDDFVPSMFMFDSSKIKVWKKGSQVRRAFQIKRPDGVTQVPPMFAHLSVMSTVKETNKHGTWFNFQWDPANGEVKDSVLGPEDPMFQAAHGWYKIVASGNVKFAISRDEEVHVDEADVDAPF